ncbi:MAG: NTP transferase domain-containing protein, partial [Candidatus Latescibacteria bacterium]|nr:NTP transferase domain-containing protein [Candidatus Latescibacterota bacterium]
MVKTAVILAAGYGSRINGSGKGMPKPLIPVVGMPLLRRVILTAKRAGIKRCVVVIGHESDRVRKV